MEWVYGLMVLTAVPLSVVGSILYMTKNYSLSKKQRKLIEANISEMKDENTQLKRRLEVLEGIAISLSDGVISPDEEAQFEELKQTVQRTESVEVRR